MRELTEEERSKIIMVANVNMMCGQIHALHDQQAYLVSSGFKGKQKRSYDSFMSASKRLVDDWAKMNNTFNEAVSISDEIHSALYTVKNKLIKKYTSYVLID